jgi:hypothetical protein
MRSVEAPGRQTAVDGNCRMCGDTLAGSPHFGESIALRSLVLCVEVCAWVAMLSLLVGFACFVGACVPIVVLMLAADMR